MEDDDGWRTGRGGGGGDEGWRTMKVGERGGGVRGVGGVGGGGVWEGYAHAICTCDRGGGGTMIII